MGGCKERLVYHPFLGRVLIRRRSSSEDSEDRRRRKAAKKARKRAEEAERREREEAERMEREAAERRFHEEEAAAERARQQHLAMVRYQHTAAVAAPGPVVRAGPLAPSAPPHVVARKPEPSGSITNILVNNPQIHIGQKPICHYKLKSGDHCSKAPNGFVLNKSVCTQHHGILHEMKKKGQSVSSMLV